VCLSTTSDYRCIPTIAHALSTLATRPGSFCQWVVEVGRAKNANDFNGVQLVSTHLPASSHARA
jgi:hypothetical protein